MRIGIISDTHDNLPKIREAVNILNQQRIDFLLHCGDYVAPFALTPLETLNCDWVGVFGNNDGERSGLLAKSKNRIKPGPHYLELAAKKIALAHRLGDYQADIIAFGHSHQAEIKASGPGKAFTINPGEVGGWLSGQSSLAVLDLTSLKAEIINF